MATIVTVHGTFASGPEQGNAWWQRGSGFEARLRDLLGAAAGDLAYVPFVWSGINSETERRKAATALLARLEQLERAGESYVVIGHSHGGSTIASALYQAAMRGNSLPHMRRWITIGTPFIYHKRDVSLFSRLSTVGRAGYMVIVYLLVTLLAYFGYAYIVEGDYFPADVLFFLPFVLAYVLLRWLQVVDGKLYKARDQARAREMFEGRWLGLRHGDDEAIQGLASLRSAKVTIFGREFAVPTLSLVSLLVLPLGILLVASSPEAMRMIVSVAKSIDPRAELSYFQNDPGGAPAFVKNGFLLVALPAYVFLGLFERIGLSFGVSELLSMIVGFAFVVATSWALSLALLQVVTWIARLVSLLLSHWLNDVTWAQINRSALGGDAVGETAQSVSSQPFWASKASRPLPVEIAAKLSEHADRQAGIAVAKMRQVLGKIAFQEGPVQGADAMTGYLTWQELIHTAYFSIPELQTLVACEVVRAGLLPAAHVPDGAPGLAIAQDWLAAEPPLAGSEGAAA